MLLVLIYVCFIGCSYLCISFHHLRSFVFPSSMNCFHRLGTHVVCLTSSSGNLLLVVGLKLVHSGSIDELCSKPRSHSPGWRGKKKRMQDIIIEIYGKILIGLSIYYVVVRGNTTHVECPCWGLSSMSWIGLHSCVMNRPFVLLFQ